MAGMPFPSLRRQNQFVGMGLNVHSNGMMIPAMFYPTKLLKGSGGWNGDSDSIPFWPTKHVIPDMGCF